MSLWGAGAAKRMPKPGGWALLANPAPALPAVAWRCTCEVPRRGSGEQHPSRLQLMRLPAAVHSFPLPPLLLCREPGTSMRAGGHRLDEARAGGGNWSRAKQARTDTHPVKTKQRWYGTDMPRGAGDKSRVPDTVVIK